jgi:hypothetical protein
MRIGTSASICAALLLAGCYPDTPILIKTQRLPRPMEDKVSPLPPGTLDQYPPGPEEVTVVRHADPVQIRPAGLSSSFPMPFYSKQARVNSGTWVLCGAGGRSEVFWPNGSRVLLDGHGTGVIGSASRGEPTFSLHELDRARILLMPEDRIELLGGAILVVDEPLAPPPEPAPRPQVQGADDQDTSLDTEAPIEMGPHAVGPIVLEHPREEIMRVINRCKESATVLFREESLRVEPGEALDIPLLDAGGRPFQPDPGFQTLAGRVEVRGEVEVVSGPHGEALRALGEHEMRALGVRVRLDTGEAANFSDLSGHSLIENEPADSSEEDSSSDGGGL